MKSRNLAIFCASLAFAAFIPGIIYSQEVRKAQRTIYYFNPSWSPDGSRILFESTLENESHIYSIAADGSDLRRHTDHSSGQPAWSADGKRIVYYRDIDGNLQLFINSAAGAQEQPLIRSKTQDYGASWSSRDEIAFMSNSTPDKISHSIFSIQADGSGLRQLTDTSFDCTTPRWSPDGRRILFLRGTWTSKTYQTISREEMKKINQSFEIMVMRANGKRAYRVANSQSSFKSPVWSRNGKSIYVKVELDSATRIYRMNKRGKKLTPVCQINKRIGSFDISPREDIVVFEYARDKKYSLVTFDIRNGTEHHLIGDA